MLLFAMLVVAPASETFLIFADRLVSASTLALFLLAVAGLPIFVIASSYGLKKYWVVVVMISVFVECLSLLFELTSFPNTLGLERWLRTFPQMALWAAAFATAFGIGAGQCRIGPSPE